MFNQPIVSNNDTKNLKNFINLAQNARLLISEALETDELRTKNNGVVTRNSIILKYKNALRKVSAALEIKLINILPEKKQEVEQTRLKLQKYLTLITERITNLEQEGSSSKSLTLLPNNSSKKLINNTQLLKNVNKSMGEEILTTIIYKTGIKLSDVEGNEDAKRALEESVIFPALNPSLFTGLRAPCKGILLYGPPGNGKTMIAKAVADEANYYFFNISAATIMSKWVGDGEKMVKTLFQVARNAQPSIIFIDEIDSMLCDRNENENGAARRVKTEFLLQLDGCNCKNEDQILVLAATNRPHELDDGILRRFQQKIFIDLPDQKIRAKVIVKNFEQSKTKFSITEKELSEISRETENYSFSDLYGLCRAAAMIPIQCVTREKLCQINEKQLRSVNFNDLREALKNVRPSTNAEKRLKLQEFAGFCKINDKT